MIPYAYSIEHLFDCKDTICGGSFAAQHKKHIWRWSHTSIVFPVGKYSEHFNIITGQHLPCGDIYQSQGLAKHIKRHHPGMEHLLNNVPLIIAEPDFVGKHPKEPDSVELVKMLDDATMVCVKLDHKSGTLYVASVFTISYSKLQNRLSSGRLRPYKNVDF